MYDNNIEYKMPQFTEYNLRSRKPRILLNQAEPMHPKYLKANCNV